ncbi:hypothetical protein BHE74_00024185 [Ensete ventricosum]|uniref:Uncharacterized protein n=1 Tax=Ensete ventricosum TaxID=4639 RepID=A0A444G629_ENSVE|nr:hypothetical protein B296_00022759 [Ensete ventricosum]RWW30281.1 hypothetical protein GW17_00005142 [Ensete ventricosum]RWW68303.1 hypothetical protein BHE74_00024185 [Ensete ventricosum]RZR78646.1 hypothetical protein BHM03_00004064 [Ensete ventricosum]
MWKVQPILQICISDSVSCLSLLILSLNLTNRCLAYVKARKQLSLHEVPNILTIVLKRFQVTNCLGGLTGKYGKINKCVTFSEMLDMIPFVTGTADNPPLYLLYAVVVHVDTLNASFSGHYISYVKDLEGTWFRIDDSEVTRVQ